MHLESFQNHQWWWENICHNESALLEANGLHIYIRSGMCILIDAQPMAKILSPDESVSYYKVNINQ